MTNDEKTRARDMPSFIELGWGAPPISDQFEGFASKPHLEQFDADSLAISRLRLRGYLTDSAHRSIVKKMIDALGKAINSHRKGLK